jgi:hypothetical protein
MELKRPLDLVHNQLEAYARRGVFRSFSQTRADGKDAEFRFFWLWNLPFRLTFDAKRKALAFKNLLPDVPAGSELNSQLKAFIKDRCSNDLPEHRRIDPQQVSVRCSNVKGHVSISFQVKKSGYDYAVRKALHLITEILVGFLNVEFPEYTAQHFHKRED